MLPRTRAISQAHAGVRTSRRHTGGLEPAPGASGSVEGRRWLQLDLAKLGRLPQLGRRSCPTWIAARSEAPLWGIGPTRIGRSTDAERRTAQPSSHHALHPTPGEVATM